MFTRMWNLSAAIRGHLRFYMPTNIAIDWLRSRRGLRWAVPAAFVVPGGAGVDPRLQHWADSRHLDVEPLGADWGHGDNRRSGGGSLQRFKPHRPNWAVTASSTAKLIGYPTTDVDLQRGHTPVRAVLLAVASLTLAVLVGLAPVLIDRRRQLAAGSITTA